MSGSILHPSTGDDQPDRQPASDVPPFKVPIPAGYKFSFTSFGAEPVMGDAEKNRYFLLLHSDGSVTWQREAES